MAKRLEPTGPGATIGGGSEIENEIKLVFPAKNDFQRLQQFAEYNSRVATAFTVCGIFRRMYHDPLLKDFQEEFSLNSKSLDRRGEIGILEWLAARKLGTAEDKDNT